eukprot:COSAG06_NODE_550_length_14402_cov_4.593092_12_plen_85_part_00
MQPEISRARPPEVLLCCHVYRKVAVVIKELAIDILINTMVSRIIHPVAPVLKAFGEPPQRAFLANAGACVNCRCPRILGSASLV